MDFLGSDQLLYYTKEHLILFKTSPFSFKVSPHFMSTLPRSFDDNLLREKKHSDFLVRIWFLISLYYVLYVFPESKRTFKVALQTLVLPIFLWDIWWKYLKFWRMHYKACAWPKLWGGIVECISWIDALLEICWYSPTIWCLVIIEQYIY